MAEQKYIKFITALINATKNDTIEWSYLDSNKLLYQGMSWVKATTIYDNLIGNTSLKNIYTNILSMLFYII